MKNDESKPVDAACRESAERYHALADSTNDWEYWLAPDGSLPYVSASCERITGYRPEDFQREPELLIKIVHADDRAFLAHHVREEGKPAAELGHRGLDFRIVTRRGEERWINHECQPISDREGKFLGRRASNRDITKRQHLAEVVERLYNLLAAVVDGLPSAVALVRGQDLRYQYVNPAYQALAPGQLMLGRTIPEVWGKRTHSSPTVAAGCWRPGSPSWPWTTRSW